MLVHPRAIVSLQGRLNFSKADDEYVISPKECGGSAGESGQRPVCTPQTQGYVNYDYFYMATEP